MCHFLKRQQPRCRDKVDKITDTTHIAKVLMKRLLSHVNTKMKLTQFLPRKTLEKGSYSGKDVVVAWGSQCKATHKDVAYLESSQ